MDEIHDMEIPKSEDGVPSKQLPKDTGDVNVKENSAPDPAQTSVGYLNELNF